MKITGIFACWLLLAAASVRADSFSFRDNYFKNSMPGSPGLSLKSGTHTADWDRNTWTFSAVNEGPQGFFSKIDPGKRAAKPVKTMKAGKAPGTFSFTPIISPDPRFDDQGIVRKPKLRFDYKLKLLPDDLAAQR